MQLEVYPKHCVGKLKKVSAYPVHHLTVVLYSKKHLKKEKEEFTGCDYDIICINAEPFADIDVPMTPATMLRNHLGADFGGSGVPIDKEKYKKSVEFWSNHAMIEQ